MKIITILYLFFFSIYKVYGLSDLYISKKDVETKEYFTDCDFQLFDSNNVVVESWNCNVETKYVSNLSNGFYKLVSRPLINGTFNDELSDIYSFYVKDDILELTFYNNKIDTPDNLNYNNNYYLGFFVIICGFLFCWHFYKT